MGHLFIPTFSHAATKRASMRALLSNDDFLWKEKVKFDNTLTSKWLCYLCLIPNCIFKPHSPPKVMAFTWFTNSHEPTAFRSPTCILTTTTQTHFAWKVWGGWRSNQSGDYKSWLFSSLSITELNVNDGFIPLSIVIVNFAATAIQRKQFLVMKIQMSNHL